MHRLARGYSIHLHSRTVLIRQNDDSIPGKADLACSDSWEPSLKAFEQFTVERGTSDLQKQMGASLYPTHVLSLAEPSSN
jgi:hypothetical protein